MINAPSGANGNLLPVGAGHVGWAFLVDPFTGEWMYGANEGPGNVVTGNQDSKTWSGEGYWADLVKTFADALDGPGGANYYHAASKGRDGAAHAATETGELACGNKPHPNATVTDVSTELTDTTCRTCRSQLGLDDSDEANGRLEALFVISITLGLRPGELRKLTWDHVDLDRGVVHVWRSASKSGDTKTPKSKRSLELPKRAIAALTVHKQRQARERRAAGGAWHDNDLVFCHENGDPYTSDQLNWRFAR